MPIYFRVIFTVGQILAWLLTLYFTIILIPKSVMGAIATGLLTLGLMFFTYKDFQRWWIKKDGEK